MVWAKFILCILIILFFGRRAAKYGDILAYKTKLGGLWIGLILLAVLTSLPELFTGISAVTLVGAPDLTIGDLFGANTFNLMNLALLDIIYRNGSFTGVVSPSHRLIGWFSLVLVLVAAASIFISSRFSPIAIGWIGWYTPLIIILYLVFVRQLFKYEQSHPSPEVENPRYGELTLKRVWVHFTISAVFIIGAGTWLAIIGDEIAVAYGWGESFVGTLFIAFTTSLPEITVSFAAMRIGAVDMAVANMIGSNLFNMTIIPIDDLFYLPGSVLASVSESNIITASVVMLMTLIFIAGLHFRPRRFFRLSWCNLSLIVLFLVGVYLSFTLA